MQHQYTQCLTTPDCYGNARGQLVGHACGFALTVNDASRIRRLHVCIHPTRPLSLAGSGLIIHGQAWESEWDWENCHIPSHLFNPHWVWRQRRAQANRIRPRGGWMWVREGLQWRSGCVT